MLPTTFYGNQKQPLTVGHVFYQPPNHQTIYRNPNFLARHVAMKIHREIGIPVSLA